MGMVVALIAEYSLPDTDGGGSLLTRPTTYYHFDANGNLDGVTDARRAAPSNPALRATYDPAHTTTFKFDELGRKVVDILPTPDGTTPYVNPYNWNYFDAFDNLQYVVNSNGATSATRLPSRY